MKIDYEIKKEDTHKPAKLEYRFICTPRDDWETKPDLNELKEITKQLKEQGKSKNDGK